MKIVKILPRWNNVLPLCKLRSRLGCHCHGSRPLGRGFLRGLLLLSLILFKTATIEDVYAKGLSVSPASYKWCDVKIGTLVKCPVNIMVKNDAKEAKSFTLKIVTPSEMDTEVTEGFEEMPVRSWFSFDTKRVTIGPGEWKEVKMFINIPEEKQNFNQKWDFFVEIKEYIAGGEIFALACYSRFHILTEK